MTHVRKFIDNYTTFIAWKIEADGERSVTISDGKNMVSLSEWGRDKKSLLKHDKEVALLIDQLLAYREALAKEIK